MLFQQIVNALAKARLFPRFCRKSLDHGQPCQVLLQHRVHPSQPLLYLPKKRPGHAAKNHEQHKRDRQNRQDHQRQPEVGQHQDRQRAHQQHQRLQSHQQPLGQEHPQPLHVVRRPDHQLPRPVPVVVTEAQPLDLGEEVIAQLEGDILRKHLGHVHLEEGEPSPGNGKNHHRQPRNPQRPRRIFQVQPHVGQVETEPLGRHLLDRLR